MEFDYSYLRGFIRENFGSNRRYSRFLGISETALYDRLANKTPFTQVEINKTMGVSSQHVDINLLFFNQKIRKTVQK